VVNVFTVDKRVSEREFMRHQSRTLPLVSLGRVGTFICTYFVPDPPLHRPVPARRSGSTIPLVADLCGQIKYNK